MHDFLHAAFERHAAADAFRYQLFQVVFRVLEVAILGPLLHGLNRTHAAVCLEATSFVDDGFSGALFRACQHRSNHDGMSTSREGFDDVSRVANAAVCDDGHSRAFQGRTDLHDGSQLRHSNAGDDTRGANRARSDADFDGVRAGLDQGQGRLSRGDVAGHNVDAAKGLLHVANRVDDATAVAVGGVDNDRVHSGIHKSRDALVRVCGNAHGGRNAEAAVLVLAGVGEFAQLDDVAVRDEADKFARAVHDRKFFNAVFAQDLLRLGKVTAIFCDDEVFARHELRDGAGALLFKA